MKLFRWILILLAVVVVGCAAFYKVRNPERRELDAAAREGVSGRFVKLADGVTHYDVAGSDSGSRVVLVHGFSVPSYIWDSTTAALVAAGFRVARYDEFGRGYSDRPRVRYDQGLYNRQLLQLLDSLGWRDPVAVAGLSMGGLVAASFAGQHPDRVRSLVMIDPAAGPPNTVPAMFKLPVIGPMLWQALAVPGMADGQLSDFVEPSRWPDWPDQYRVQMQYRGFGRALLSTLRSTEHTSRDSVYARAGRTGVPALLLWGKEDKTVSIEHADGVRRAIPQVRYHVIEHAAHLPQMERTDVVNPLLIAFLRSAGAPADSTKAAR